MNSLEGRRGQPRVKPPFPAAVGAFGMPSTINNVETLAAVPHIVANGGDWYRQWGRRRAPGTKLFCVSRAREQARQLRAAARASRSAKLIEEVCGGMRNGNALKAVIPGRLVGPDHQRGGGVPAALSTTRAAWRSARCSDVPR